MAGVSGVSAVQTQPFGGAFRGAYDAFASSIVHAYEPARRVLTSYTGNLVRLRRASDNAEADFGYLTNGDLDVAAIAAWAGGASYVVTGCDQAPAGDDVTQAVAADQPLYVASAKNGHAGMTLDGLGDRLQGTFTTGGAVAQPFSVFAVAQLDATVVNDNANHYGLSGSVAGNMRIIRQRPAATPDAWNMYFGLDIDGGDSDSDWNVWSVLASGASSQFWTNGVSEGVGNAGANSILGLTLGARGDGSLSWKGPFVSAVVADPSLSDAQRVAMQNAMNAYWSCF